MRYVPSHVLAYVWRCAFVGARTRMCVPTARVCLSSCMESLLTRSDISRKPSFGAWEQENAGSAEGDEGEMGGEDIEASIRACLASNRLMQARILDDLKAVEEALCKNARWTARLQVHLEKPSALDSFPPVPGLSPPPSHSTICCREPSRTCPLLSRRCTWFEFPLTL